MNFIEYAPNKKREKDEYWHEYHHYIPHTAHQEWHEIIREKQNQYQAYE
jgi:hypothetical protein